MKAPSEMNEYELLGLEPGATHADVRRAWERLSVLLAPGSLPLYSLLDRGEQEELLERVHRAYEALSRDLAQGTGAAAADGEAEETLAAGAAGEPPKEDGLAEAVAAGTVTGEQLRAYREAHGVPLKAVADRTRVPQRLLEAVEAEDFDQFPVRVYLRGFVIAYARDLDLEPAAVWACYEKRWEAWHERRDEPEEAREAGWNPLRRLRKLHGQR